MNWKLSKGEVMSHTPEQIIAAANFLDLLKGQSHAKEQDLKTFLMTVCNSEVEKNEEKRELKIFAIDWEITRNSSGSISILALDKEEAERFVDDLDPEDIVDGSIVHESNKVTYCAAQSPHSFDIDFISEAEEREPHIQALATYFK